MIAHHDYQDSGSSIIKIFDDHIEFFNPGKLYDDMTIEKLQSGSYSSRTRNRAIANVLKEVGVIEKYGSGIQRIKNECKIHGVKEPIFEEFDHGFRVILFKEILGGGVSRLPKNNKVTDIFICIQNNPNLKAIEISKILDIPQRTTERLLKQLKDENEIEFQGSSKNGGYFAK